MARLFWVYETFSYLILYCVLLFGRLFTMSGDYDAPNIKTLHHNGTIGLYSWYSEGVAHMDMIPVTPEKLDSLAQDGAELIDFRATGD